MSCLYDDAINQIIALLFQKHVQTLIKVYVINQIIASLFWKKLPLQVAYTIHFQGSLQVSQKTITNHLQGLRMNFYQKIGHDKGLIKTAQTALF